MNGHVAERSLRKRTSAIEAELDALVAREVAALQRAATRDQPRTPGRKRDGAAPAPREPRPVFEETEADFIEKTAAFLSGRPDRDVILETIWSRVLAEPVAAGHPEPSPEPAVEAPPAEAGEDGERPDS